MATWKVTVCSRCSTSRRWRARAPIRALTTSRARRRTRKRRRSPPQAHPPRRRIPTPRTRTSRSSSINSIPTNRRGLKTHLRMKKPTSTCSRSKPMKTTKKTRTTILTTMMTTTRIQTRISKKMAGTTKRISSSLTSTSSTTTRDSCWLPIYSKSTKTTPTPSRFRRRSSKSSSMLSSTNVRRGMTSMASSRTRRTKTKMACRARTMRTSSWRISLRSSSKNYYCCNSRPRRCNNRTRWPNRMKMVKTSMKTSRRTTTMSWTISKAVASRSRRTTSPLSRR